MDKLKDISKEEVLNLLAQKRVSKWDRFIADFLASGKPAISIKGLNKAYATTINRKFNSVHVFQRNKVTYMCRKELKDCAGPRE